MIHKIIDELLDKRFHLGITKDTLRDELVFTLNGFYKSGTVDLRIVDKNKLMAYSRYAQMDEIYDFTDLVRLNHQWWHRSIDKGWSAPENDWLPYLLKEGLVTKTTHTTDIYE